MSNSKNFKQYGGGCLCGQTAYIASGQPINPHLCSCTMCQKSSGAPTVAWVSFQLENFQWAKNKPNLYQSSEKIERVSCKKCGGLLATLEEGSSTICITIASLDDPSLIVPLTGKHSYKESAPNWWLPALKEK